MMVTQSDNALWDGYICEYQIYTCQHRGCKNCKFRLQFNFFQTSRSNSIEIWPSAKGTPFDIDNPVFLKRRKITFGYPNNLNTYPTASI